MYKLYSTDGKLIGYSDYKINTSFTGIIREKELELVHSKIKVLGINEEFDNSYYIDIYKKYGPKRCIDISNGIMMVSKFAMAQYVKHECNGIFCDNFYNCSHTSVSIDTSHIKTMRNWFSFCKMDKLDLSSFNTSKVTDMRGMFCRSSVQSINLSSFDTSKVTDMSAMFSFCEVNELDLSNFDTHKVTNMQAMFSNTKLVDIDLRSFDTHNVTDMSYMFYGTTSAEVIDLRTFNFNKVKDFNNMFGCCDAGILISSDGYKILSKLKNNELGISKQQLKSKCSIV